MKPHIVALALSSIILTGQAASAQREHPRAEVPSTSLCPPGFAALQSSDTCVRVGGRVRAEGIVGSPRTRSSGMVDMHASGHIQLDIRKRTEYGPVRAFIRAKGPRS